MKWAFFAGLGAGAALGMLIAPKSGSEWRDEVQEFARESFEQMRDRSRSAIEQARDKADSAATQARDHVEPVMVEVRRRIDSVTTQASSVADRVVDSNGEHKPASLFDIINEWPHDRLIAIDGIGPVLAQKIIQHRPYRSEEELIERKELPPSAIESLRKAA
jgi:gas vesicle protein